MGKRSRFSKEIKIKACKDYENGNGSFISIGEAIGATKTTVRQWYLRYIVHGSSSFEILEDNRSYSKTFKISVIEAYNSGKYSIAELAGKYNLANSLVGRWIDKGYNGIEMKDYDPKGEVYTMKARETTLKERLEIVKWVVENDMSYKNAAAKYSINYALVYKWTKGYMDKGEEALDYKKRGPKLKSQIDESKLTEVEKLKFELEKEKTLRKRREFELEVLKKKEEFEQQLLSQKLGKKQNTKR